jgi:hypothetical protein
MSKRKPTYLQRKNQDTINKKAIYWTGAVVIVIIILMTVLLILGKP